MKRAFKMRVIREGIVDTRRYRYVFRDYWHWAFIERIPIKLLDTTAVYSEWEVVDTVTTAEAKEAWR